MRAAFSFSFAISGTVFDLKAYQTVDESKVEVKRVTAYKDAVSGTVSSTKRESKVSVADAKIENVKVAKATGEIVSDDHILKGVWRNDHEFVEITDESLADLRMSNGEFRVLGFSHMLPLRSKGQIYNVMPSKDTKEAHKRFLGLLWALVDDGGVLLIEGSVRGKQRLYGLVEDQINHVLMLQEFAYASEHTEFDAGPLNAILEQVEQIPEVDINDLPILDEVPDSSFLTAFNDKYGEKN